MINGFLPVWKEQDFTSFDVIAKMRGILHQKKIGHTGTLDPNAEGVLLVGLGSATRACSLLPDSSKVYRAKMLLGITTDTQDIWGKVLTEKKADVPEETFRKAILSFQGKYSQMPPMYSAKKVNGKKLYEIARQGKEIERKPCEVTIYGIDILEIGPDWAEFTVSCSSGTYIRTLCSDIGDKLGTGACMTALTRICAGGYERKDCLTLSEMEKERDQGTLENFLIPVEKALDCFQKVELRRESAKQILNGNAFSAEGSGPVLRKDKELFRVFLEDVGFVAVYQWSDESGHFQPYKMFLPEA